MQTQSIRTILTSIRPCNLSCASSATTVWSSRLEGGAELITSTGLPSFHTSSPPDESNRMATETLHRTALKLIALLALQRPASKSSTGKKERASPLKRPIHHPLNLMRNLNPSKSALAQLLTSAAPRFLESRGRQSIDSPYGALIILTLLQGCVAA